eukprot:2806784-Alexandrium_andersonii.AAC.1
MPPGAHVGANRPLETRAQRWLWYTHGGAAPGPFAGGHLHPCHFCMCRKVSRVAAHIPIRP